VSDCHVPAEPQTPYRGLNAERNLQSLLPVMRGWRPDLIVATGDISEDASPAAYSRVAGMLGSIDAPLLALPGNHDIPDVMSEHFSQGPWNGPFIREAGPWALVLLDSTVRGSISGSFSPDYLERFDACLRNSDANYLLVALHHQPVAVKAPWIDRYALEEPDRFLQCVDREPRIRCVAWGHIHHAFGAERNGVTLLGAPSAAANSLPESSRFTPDPAGPACRWLELYGDGRVETGLLRSRSLPD